MHPQKIKDIAEERDEMTHYESSNLLLLSFPSVEFYFYRAKDTAVQIL